MNTKIEIEKMKFYFQIYFVNILYKGNNENLEHFRFLIIAQ